MKARTLLTSICALAACTATAFAQADKIGHSDTVATQATSADIVDTAVAAEGAEAP